MHEGATPPRGGFQAYDDERKAHLDEIRREQEAIEKARQDGLEEKARSAGETAPR